MKKTAQVLEQLQQAGIYPDRFYKKPGTLGTFVFKKSYFYTMGQSADAWAEKIYNAIPASIIRTENAFKRWPTTSYFIVEFTV